MLKSLGLKKQQGKEKWVRGDILTNRQLLKGEYFMEPTVEEADEVARILNVKNHYEVLEINDDKKYNQSQDLEKDLRDSYMAKCLLLNPNQCNHPRLEEAFKKLSEAYDTLVDPGHRAKYRHKLFDEPDPEELAQMEELQRAFGGLELRFRLPGMGMNMSIPSGGSTRYIITTGNGSRSFQTSGDGGGLEGEPMSHHQVSLLDLMSPNEPREENPRPERVRLPLPVPVARRNVNITAMQDEVDDFDRRHRRRTMGPAEARQLARAQDLAERRRHPQLRDDDSDDGNNVFEQNSNADEEDNLEAEFGNFWGNLAGTMTNNSGRRLIQRARNDSDPSPLDLIFARVFSNLPERNERQNEPEQQEQQQQERRPRRFFSRRVAPNANLVSSHQQQQPQNNLAGTMTNNSGRRLIQRPRNDSDPSPLDLIFARVFSNLPEQNERQNEPEQEEQQQQERRPRRHFARRVAPNANLVSSHQQQRPQRAVINRTANNDFTQQLAQLRSMGFGNEDRNRRVLEICNGNVDQAVNLLL